MSSFNCDHCGLTIIDTPGGYTTGCPHYPLPVENKSEREALYCPHGRPPINGIDGCWSCPHCLGLNKDRPAFHVDEKLKDAAEKCAKAFKDEEIGCDICGETDILNKPCIREIFKEICICAAVKTTKEKIFRGHQHGDCFQAIKDRHYIPSDKPEDQGFITSLNRYVDRIEGRRLQDAAEIKSVNPGGYCGNTLFSEDLY